jgi:N-acyl-D-amino-acid deacylase
MRSTSRTMDEMPFDLVLVGGQVVDGTGAPRYGVDVGVRGDRIAAVGDLTGVKASARLDLAGLIVTPGFVDTHTHDDNALLCTPDMPFKVSQGVTTVVVGNCGISLAPFLPPGELPRPLDLIGERSNFRFQRFRDYLAALETAPPAPNAVCLTGHTTLRAGVMDRLDRPARPDEIGAMAELLEEALDAGAVGLSSGLYYEAARAAPTAEVIELAQVVHRFGGLYTTHLRDEGDRVLEAMEEAFTIGRQAHVPVVLSHHKVAGRANHGRSRETLALVEKAQRKQPVAIDAYPYIAGATELSVDRVETADRVLITFSRAMPEAAGRDLAQVARDLGVPVAEAVRRLHPAGAIYFLMDEADVRRILSWPGTMIGSDGIPAEVHPHPRLWGAFPRVLGRYSRELGLFSLEEAVRRMTSLPAKRFGLRGRGIVSVGAYADLVVLDAGRVRDQATFETPALPAIGIELVLVNGQAVWQQGQRTGRRPGRVLRRQDLDRPMRTHGEDPS